MYYGKPDPNYAPEYLQGGGPEVIELQPDVDPNRVEFAEPPPPEDRRERRGESLWRVLNERHINMIAFSGTIGNGLFLGSGRSMAAAGPGGAVVAYILMGTVISSVISCVGEMTALMPVNAPMMEFPRRFLDRGVGFAIGWMYWFAYAVQAAAELVAVSNTIKFSYNDGTTVLNWTTGESVDNAVWISVFLVLVVAINMFPVRFFGELEYIFGVFKLVFIVMLIVLMIVLDTMQRSYYSEPIGTRYWNSPFSFFNPSYNVKDENGDFQREITGSVGTLVGVWSTLINVMFSYTGMDIVVATAAESRALSDSESMKMACRKINIRIVTLYTLAVLAVSFVVPVSHPYLNGQAPSVGAESAFVIAVVQAGIPMAAHFFNAVFMFSSFTCATNSMYVAARILHTLALRGQTGPEFITRRLRQCYSGVPVRATLVTAVMMMIAYMGRSGTTGQRLSELSNNCTVSLVICYCTICATYLLFYKTLDYARQYANVSAPQAAMYDRENPRYPYKSHFQWLKAFYGMVACIILLLFNGVGAFLQNPFDIHQFISAYISIPVFLLLILGYKIRKHGLRVWDYGPERSNDLSNTVQTASEKRKGRLEFPDDAPVGENFVTFVKWVWAWMK